MYKQRLLPFIGTALALMVISCERIDEPVSKATLEEIPLEYGRFVSATSRSRFETTLWFERQDKTLIGVSVNTARGTINEAVMSIQRR